MKLSSSLFSVALVLCALPAAAATAGSATPPSCPGDQPVWVNTKTKAYHLATDPLYGKTKHGTYLCKAAADAAGDHLARTGSMKSGSMGGTKGAASGASSGTGSMGATSADGDSTSTTASPAPGATATPSGKHHRRHKGASASPAPAPSAT